MSRLQIEDAVREIIATVLRRPFEQGEDILRSEEAAWDSLKHIEILFSLEDRFDIRFTEQEMADLNGLRTIVDQVEAKIGSRHPA